MERGYRGVPEAPKLKEGERVPQTEVVLHFLRHEEKETATPGQPDRTVELTKKGREKAIAKGRAEPATPEISWAAGSERVRAAQTALLRMVADKDKDTGRFTPDMSFVESADLANRELKVGKKVTHLPELNFYWEGTDGMKTEGMGAYKQGHGLEFLANESDDLALSLKDKKSLTYSRVAANYASLIAREMSAGNAFNRVVAKEPGKYEKYGNKMERYFGTHQTVSECFYMKVLEKTQGRAAVDKLIESFRDAKGQANGFDFQGGFDVTVKNGSEGQKVMLQGINGFADMELTPKLLAEVIGDAENLDQAIAQAEAA